MTTESNQDQETYAEGDKEDGGEEADNRDLSDTTMYYIGGGVAACFVLVGILWYCGCCSDSDAKEAAGCLCDCLD